MSARSGAATALREFLAARGYLIRGDHPSIDAFAIDVPAADLEALAGNPDVAGLSSDAIVRPTGTAASGSWLAPESSFLRATLGLSSSAPLGLGVGVAVIDSGIQPSLDFIGRIGGFYDLSHGDIRRALPYDDYGHGTHVAGLIGGNGFGSGLQYQGVAPGVRFVVFKVLDGTGQGLTSDVVRAIEFIAANRRLLRVDVINLSLGHPIFEPAATDPLVQAIEKASRAGLVVVAAGGNFGLNPTTGQPGYAGITSPGNAPSAITVGALQTQGTVTRSDDRVAPFSSRGPSWYDAYAKPDVLAPGDRLVSDAAPGSTLFETLSGAPGGRHAGRSATCDSAVQAWRRRLPPGWSRWPSTPTGTPGNGVG